MSGFSTCDDDKDSEQCRKAKDEQEKRAAVCAADFAQFAAASGLEAAGVGAKDLKALWKLSRSPATWGNGAVVRSVTVNFSLLPGGAALSASLGAEGGTPNPFYGRDSQIYTFASGLLVLGSGLKLGEAINSCRSAAEGKP